jgi:hypothetical protein
MMVQIAAGRENTGQSCAAQEVFHTVFHSSCEELVTARGGVT